VLIYLHYMDIQLKKSPIPIKFVINFVGPLSLDSEYWYKIKNDDEILENIEPKDIEDAIKEKKIVKTFDNELSVVKLMNAFIGGKYTDKEISEMTDIPFNTLKSYFKKNKIYKGGKKKINDHLVANL